MSLELAGSAALAPPLELRATGRRRRAMLARALWLGGGLAAIALLALLVQLALPDQAAADVEIALPEPMPMALVSATRGEEGAKAATGAAAETINASLPFSNAPLVAARPFVIQAASRSDMGRALHCLTQAVYYEAGHEPLEGRRAVAQVVLNRMRHPAFPNSVCGVVYDGATRPGCQFSFTCDGSLRRAPSAGAWAAAERVAREALNGTVTSAVGLATHYHADYVAPYWAPRLTKLSRIGAHIFYRWPGAWGRPDAFAQHYSGVEAIRAAADATEVATADVPSPPDPTDRRAPEDVGGRLDVTKGWTLSIPSPAESRGRFAATVGEQASPAAASAPSAMAAVQ